ncbi:MAG TPA: hypothetical protein VKY45_03925, partial [Marinilabiliaceae bacterium]|nr:hypothetical protein [Marinilabiliaceae bacterium]
MIVGDYIEKGVNWITTNFSGVLDNISDGMSTLIGGIESFWLWLPYYAVILLFAGVAYWKTGKSNTLFTILGLVFIYYISFWEETMMTLSLVLASAFIALLIGIPLGIWSAKSPTVKKIIRPILDL